MKTMGIIGGMSWESTSHYYELMNRDIHARLGGHHSLEAIIYSVDFERILVLVNRSEWKSVGEIIAGLAKKLEIAGVDFLILTVNAAHKVFLEVERAIKIPILHIVDPTAEAIQKHRIKKVGLLGTKVTMEEPFYKERLKSKYGIDVLIPEKEERELLHAIIFEELTVGLIRKESKEKLVAMIEDLARKGVEGVILGCTELTLLISQKDTHIPLFDTTELHAKAAVDAALGEKE
jgi:aspartate racemase